MEASSIYLVKCECCQILNNTKYEVRERETGRKFKKQFAIIPFLCCSLSWCSDCEEKVTSTPSS